MTTNEKLKALIRRRDWLSQRLEQIDRGGKAASYDAAELAALRWAIEIVEKDVGVIHLESPPPAAPDFGELTKRAASNYAEIQEHCVGQLKRLDLTDPIRFIVHTGDMLAQKEIRQIRRGPIGFEIGMNVGNRATLFTATPKIFDN
jgi:hypothetical protein